VQGSEGQSGTVGGFWGSDFGCLATSSSLCLRATRNCVMQRLTELRHKTPYRASASASKPCRAKTLLCVLSGWTFSEGDIVNWLVTVVLFWVIPRRLNFICRRFGTLSMFNLHRSCDTTCEDGRDSVPKRRQIKFRRRTIYEDGTECSETSPHIIQAQQLEHVGSLKPRTAVSYEPHAVCLPRGTGWNVKCSKSEHLNGRRCLHLSRITAQRVTDIL